MAININPTLYIGVGGTGAKTLVKIKRHFVEAYGEVPQPMIGFLAIDSQVGASSGLSTKTSGVDDVVLISRKNGENVMVNLNGKDVSLDPSDVCDVTVKGAMKTYNEGKSAFSWMPQPPFVNVSALATISGTGCGMVRSNGSFVAQFNHAVIKNRIMTALTHVLAIVPPDSKYVVATSQGNPVQPTINVICSLSGGTGTGMVVDVLMQVQEAVKAVGQVCRIIPWLLMPDIYRAIAPAASHNVNINTYGALRDFDYFIHKNPTEEVSFGNSVIDQLPFRYAFLFNNTNTNGQTVTSLDDVLDDLAKCLFLPSGDMGVMADVPFNNIEAGITGGQYNIGNKQAWCCSAGSAELVYDNKMVAAATAYSMASRLSAKLMDRSADGVSLSDAFVDRQDVKIRENGGDLHNDVIDAICDLGSASQFAFLKGQTANDIDTFVNVVVDTKRMDNNYVKKLSNTKSKLREELDRLLRLPEGGGLGACINFLGALNGLVEVCLAEMKSESEELQTTLKAPHDWDKEIAETRSFIIWVNAEAVNRLEENVNSHVRIKLDLERHSRAIQFYGQLKNTISAYTAQLEAKSQTLSRLMAEYDSRLVSLKNSCVPKSKFQVYLHTDTMKQVSVAVDQPTWLAFCDKVLPQNGNVDGWLSMSYEDLSNSIFNFAGGTAPVQEALGISIESYLNRLPQDELYKQLDYVKNLAVPMWTHNYQGYPTQSQSLTKLVFVGVFDEGNTIVNDYIKQQNKGGGNQSFLVSTRQNDRIFFMTYEAAVPVYAVNNCMQYQTEWEAKLQNHEQIGQSLASCVVDVKLDEMMKAQNFSLLPKKKQSPALDLWTKGFIFKAADGQPIIRFDEVSGQYWMRSSKYGSPAKGNRYDLGQQRNVAFDKFTQFNLYDEVDKELGQIEAKSGSVFIKETLETLRGMGNTRYLDDYVMKPTCPREVTEALVDNPAYKAVRDLIDREIELRVK